MPQEEQNPSNIGKREYLGDGVYAVFTGHSVGISVNDHRNPPVVYLEPHVLENLVRFAKSCESPKTK